MEKILSPSEVKDILEKCNYSAVYSRKIKTFYKDTYLYLVEKYPTALSFSEIVYLYVNNLQKETDISCKCCGSKNVSYVNIVIGYKNSCSISCGNLLKCKDKDDSLINKRKNQPADPPKCDNSECNNVVKKKKNGVWNIYCSFDCRGKFNSLKSRDKSKQTMMQNHGVEHALQSSIIYKKMQSSNIAKYGVPNVMNLSGSSEKLQNTKIAKYGFVSNFADPVGLQQSVDDVAQRYGCKPGEFTNVSQIPEVHLKKLQTGYMSKDYIMPSGNVVKIQGYENLFLDKSLCYFDEDAHIFGKYIKYGLNSVYLPDVVIGNNVIEVKSDYTFLAEYDKNIAKCIGSVNEGYKFNFAIFEGNGSLQFLSVSKEHFIMREYLLSENIQFEEFKNINGTVFNFYMGNIGIIIINPDFSNEVFLEKDYFVKLYAKHCDMQVITVCDVEITDVVLSSIRSKITKTNTVKIFARNTEVKDVSAGTVMFLTKNHIQGYAPCQIWCGLYVDKELVGLMGFNNFRSGVGKNRGKDAYELVRYATSANIVGGASKLLSYFVKKYNPSLVYSYSDNMISTGKMYESLGFSLEANSKERYRYKIFGEDKISHRYKFRKGALKGKLKIYDDNLSERDLMQLNKYYRVYDAGVKTWTKTF